MSTIYHTPWTTATTFKASILNTLPAELDAAIVKQRSVSVGCDGDITYNKTSGVLNWSGVIRLTHADPDASNNVILNNVTNTSLTLADNQYAYCVVTTVNNANLTAAVGTFTYASAATYLPSSHIILAYRTTSDYCYPVALRLPIIGPYQDVREQSVNVSSAETTIDFNAGSQVYAILNINSSITLANGENGRLYRIRLVQDATGSKTVNWKTTIKWKGGAGHTMSTGASTSDFIVLRMSCSTWFGEYSTGY